MMRTALHTLTKVLLKLMDVVSVKCFANHISIRYYDDGSIAARFLANRLNLFEDYFLAI